MAASAPSKPRQPLSRLRADAPTFTPGAGWVPPPRRHEGARRDEAQDPEDAGLPAVISVKKSSRGCAVVLLRSRAVLERGVRQSVAVVDGVCVEVRRHGSKRAEPGEEQMGLFVAWGHRVERKATVSAEGLEAYFNALADAPCPEGLEAQPPFEEQLLRFPLTSAAGNLLPLETRPIVDKAEQAQLLGGTFCSLELVRALWEAKGRLDGLWNIPPPPLARSLITRVARAQLFPHSGEGGKEHENRAGDKLAELSAAVGLLDGVPPGAAFLDLCGGPGAWSQHLLGQRALALRGFGFTLRSDAGEAEDWQAEDKDQWYPDLLNNPRWKALWGADGSGDLLKLGNLEHCAKRLSKERVFLCLADGGFSDRAIPPNQLELYFYRLFLAELLMAVSCLQPGGRFVCKLYTTLSAATSAILYLTTRLFESTTIVKPMSSRVTGPERYLAAFGFRGTGQETAAIRAALARSHELGGGSSPLTTPLLTPIVAAEHLERDGAFLRSARAMASGLCQRQAAALNAVVDRAEFLEDMAMSVAETATTSARKAAQKAPAPVEAVSTPQRAPWAHGGVGRQAAHGHREPQRRRRFGGA